MTFIEKMEERRENIIPTVGPYFKYVPRPDSPSLIRERVQVWKLAKFAAVSLRIPKGTAFCKARRAFKGCDAVLVDADILCDEYLVATLNGMRVMLCEGLQVQAMPDDPDHDLVAGRCSVRIKRIEPEDGDVRWELFLKMKPPTAGVVSDLMIGDEPNGDVTFGPDSSGKYVSVTSH